MASTTLILDCLQRPLRNTRKRKRENICDGNDDYESKRRRKMETFSDRSAEGFCNYCTNPYKLICCTKCFRSWHINCLNKYILNDKAIQIPVKSEYIPPKPSTQIAIIPNNINMPKLNLLSLNSEINSETKEEINDINNEIYKLKQNEKENKIKNNSNPSPIKIELPLKTFNESEINYTNNIIQWFKYITPIITSHSQLYNNKSKKQIIALFTCNDCINDTHKCFICNEINEIKPEKCIMKYCSKYYHKLCLENDINYKSHTKFYLNGKFKCPRHSCWNCTETKMIKRKFCWYCPRNYHRNCVPIESELISVQITDNIKQIQQYADFRYDLISCSNNHCPKGKDLQFGRHDINAGIFKWKLWDETICEFYKLNDDPFSIDLAMLNDYKRRKKTKKYTNIYPKNFKKIKKNRGIIKIKNHSHLSYGRCECINGCTLNNNCYNYSMDIECTSKNCGSGSEYLCENRQFKNIINNNFVKVRRTKNGCGYGAYAKRDLNENELIIEYVGEVITKEESNKRIMKLNEEKARNFYFFQIDSKTVIDGTNCGNESRFLNHSCNANCYTSIWNVDGRNRLGIFAKYELKKNTQLTYDYAYEVPDVDNVKNLARCLCGERNCRIYLGWNKKKANEWKKEQKELGNYVSGDSDDGSGRELSKKKKRKRKKKKKKKKKKHKMER